MWWFTNFEMYTMGSWSELLSQTPRKSRLYTISAYSSMARVLLLTGMVVHASTFPIPCPNPKTNPTSNIISSPTSISLYLFQFTSIYFSNPAANPTACPIPIPTLASYPSPSPPLSPAIFITNPILRCYLVLNLPFISSPPQPQTSSPHLFSFLVGFCLLFSSFSGRIYVYSQSQESPGEFSVVFRGVMNDGWHRGEANPGAVGVKRGIFIIHWHLTPQR